MERAGENSPFPHGCLTILETKSLIRPEEVKLSLSPEKWAGDRFSTRATAEFQDKQDKVTGIVDKQSPLESEVSGNVTRAQLHDISQPCLTGSTALLTPGITCLVGHLEPTPGQLRPWNGSFKWATAEFWKIQGPDNAACLWEGFPRLSVLPGSLPQHKTVFLAWLET